MRFHSGTMILLSVSLLSGCDAMKARTYVKPAGGDVAEITFAINGNGVGSTYIYDEAENCTSRNFTPRLAKGGRFTTEIAAGRELSFSMWHYLGNSHVGTHCEVVATFLPEKGGRYGAYLNMVENGCQLGIFKRSAIDKSGFESVPYRRRAPIPPGFSERASFCQDYDEPN